MEMFFIGLIIVGIGAWLVITNYQLGKLEGRLEILEKGEK